MQLDEKSMTVFQQRYAHIHPLLLWRSIERAKTPGDLFDILESIPEFPVAWSDEEHCWKGVGRFPNHTITENY